MNKYGEIVSLRLFRLIKRSDVYLIYIIGDSYGKYEVFFFFFLIWKFLFGEKYVYLK